jgi:hypothetical protein
MHTYILLIQAINGITSLHFVKEFYSPQHYKYSHYTACTSKRYFVKIREIHVGLYNLYITVEA